MARARSSKNPGHSIPPSWRLGNRSLIVAPHLQAPGKPCCWDLAQLRIGTSRLVFADPAQPGRVTPDVNIRSSPDRLVNARAFRGSSQILSPANNRNYTTWLRNPAVDSRASSSYRGGPVPGGALCGGAWYPYCSRPATALVHVGKRRAQLSSRGTKRDKTKTWQNEMV